MRPLPFIIGLTLLAGLLAGPGPCAAAAPAAGPVRVQDLRGREINLAQPAQRIVCLIESALSGLYMLGAGEQVVGVSTNIYQGEAARYYAALDARIAARRLAAPGNWDFVNLESVVALRPDLVIIWSHQTEAIRALESRGIPVYGVFIKTFADVHRELADLGRLTGRGERAAELERLTQAELAILARTRATLAAVQRPRVYYMWAQGELETSGRGSTVDELIGLAGGVNVAGQFDQEHLVVNLERLLAWNPQVIVMWPNSRRTPADVMALSAWRGLAAVRTGRVHQFPDTFSCDLWTLKYIHAAKVTARWCHPEAVSGADPAAERATLLRALYGPAIAPALAPAGAER